MNTKRHLTASPGSRSVLQFSDSLPSLYYTALDHLPTAEQQHLTQSLPFPTKPSRTAEEDPNTPAEPKERRSGPWCSIPCDRCVAVYLFVAFVVTLGCTVLLVLSTGRQQPAQVTTPRPPAPLKRMSNTSVPSARGHPNDGAGKSGSTVHVTTEPAMSSNNTGGEEMHENEDILESTRSHV